MVDGGLPWCPWIILFGPPLHTPVMRLWFIFSYDPISWTNNRTGQNPFGPQSAGDLSPCQMAMFFAHQTCTCVVIGNRLTSHGWNSPSSVRKNVIKSIFCHKINHNFYGQPLRRDEEMSYTFQSACITCRYTCYLCPWLT